VHCGRWRRLHGASALRRPRRHCGVMAWAQFEDIERDTPSTLRETYVCLPVARVLRDAALDSDAAVWLARSLMKQRHDEAVQSRRKLEAAREQEKLLRPGGGTAAARRGAGAAAGSGAGAASAATARVASSSRRL
jgi:hypothetical protein